MTVKTAIESGDAVALQRLLAEDATCANTLIRWGKNDSILTHPLHYVCDMLFEGTLERGSELPLIEALIRAGADLDFQRASKTDSPLIGAASLGAEDVGLALLHAGARPDRTGIFGETALHWAALLGEDRLAAGLIASANFDFANLDLKDEKYSSSPLGWAIHGRQNPPAGNQGKQCEVAAQLVAAGAKVDPSWLESEQTLADPRLLDALRNCSLPG